MTWSTFYVYRVSQDSTSSGHGARGGGGIPVPGKKIHISWLSYNWQIYKKRKIDTFIHIFNYSDLKINYFSVIYLLMWSLINMLSIAITNQTKRVARFIKIIVFSVSCGWNSYLSNMWGKFVFPMSFDFESWANEGLKNIIINFNSE